jgi:DNA-directed RNA polymerase specialized sigma24 family protein
VADRKEPDRAPESKGGSEDFVAWLQEVPDPQERYRRATEELEKHQEAVERLSQVRASAAADAYEVGGSVRGLAERLGVSPSRIHQLIQEAKAQPARKAGRTKRQPGRKKGDT